MPPKRQMRQHKLLNDCSIGSPTKEVPKVAVDAYKRNFPSREDPIMTRRLSRNAVQAGAQVLHDEDKLKLLRQYDELTREFAQSASASIKSKIREIEKKLLESNTTFTRESGIEVKSASKAAVEAQEDEQAARLSRESYVRERASTRASTAASGAGSSTDPMPNAKTPKQPRRGDPFGADLSPHLDPAVGGSGGRPTHAMVFDKTPKSSRE